jgi:hypothetical protein
MKPLTGEDVLAARVAELLARVPRAGYTTGIQSSHSEYMFRRHCKSADRLLRVRKTLKQDLLQQVSQVPRAGYTLGIHRAPSVSDRVADTMGGTINALIQ